MILVDSGGWIDYFRGRPTAQTDLLDEHIAQRQRSALLVVGAATRPAQGVATIPQLWPAPSQLQAAPTPGAVALEAQARRDRALPGGRGIVGRGTARHTANPGRAPKLQCRCCGSAMEIVRRRIAAPPSHGGPAGPPGALREGSIH